MRVMTDDTPCISGIKSENRPVVRTHLSSTRTHILSQNVCHKNLGDPEPDHIHRSRSPLSSKRLSSNNTSAVSDSAESVFRERRGLERPPRPVEVVAETPNVTVTNNGGNDDSLNSSTASQVQYTSDDVTLVGIPKVAC